MTNTSWTNTSWPEEFPTGEDAPFEGESTRTLGEAVEQIYAPAFYEGHVRGTTIIPDLATTITKKLLDLGVDGLRNVIGEDNLPHVLNKAADSFLKSSAVSAGDLAVGGFNLLGKGARKLEEALVSTYSREALEKLGVNPETHVGSDYGFRTEGAAPASKGEEHLKNIATMTGMGMTFAVNPVAYSMWLKALGSGERLAVETLNTARGAVKNKLSALSKGIDEFGKTYVKQFTSSPTYKTLQEALLGAASGVGFETVPFFQDDPRERIMIGDVDVKPTLQTLLSMGIPTLLSVGPAGVLTDPEIRGPLAKLTDKLRNLTGGFTEKGRTELASRIFHKLLDDDEAADALLQGIKDGWIVSPYSSTTQLKVLEDGQIIPRNASLTPNTFQALRELGFANPGIAKLERSLIKDGGGPSYLKEVARRDELVAEFVSNIKTRLDAGGNPEDVAKYVDEQVTKLTALSLEDLNSATQTAARAYELVEPKVGHKEAATVARSILDGNRAIAKKRGQGFWDEVEKTIPAIDASRLGEFAAGAIDKAGRNRFRLPSMYYILAGKNRLYDLGIGKRGEPIPREQLPEAIETPGQKIDEALIPPNGRYDVHGDVDATARPVTIKEIQGLRSQLRTEQRALNQAKNPEAAKNVQHIIDEIDNNILTEENLYKALDQSTPSGENAIPTLRTAIQFTKHMKETYERGPVGEILQGKVPPEETLEVLIKQRGVASKGVPIVAYKEALSHPVLSHKNLAKVVDDPNISIFEKSLTNVPREDLRGLEAELLGRLARTVPVNIKPEEIPSALIDRFIRTHENALDEIPGLKADIQNYQKVRKVVETIQDRMLKPSQDQVQKALEAGGTVKDVTDAVALRKELLAEQNEQNAASLILGTPRSDWKNVIQNFMKQQDVQRAAELRRLVDNDETGAALKGVRGGIFRELIDNSQTLDKRTNKVFTDLSKFKDNLAKHRPLVNRFFDDTQQGILDEMAAGSALQDPLAPSAVAIQTGPRKIREEASSEVERQAVAAIGRSLGANFLANAFFINPLVGTALGRQIATLIHVKVGEKPLLKTLEKALKDPLEAEKLIRLRQSLPDFEDVLKTQKGEIIENAGKKMGQTIDLLTKMKESRVRMLAQYGLIGARQATGENLSLQDDWDIGVDAGGYFIYPENRVRWEISQETKPKKSIVRPTIPPTRLPSKTWGGLGQQSSLQNINRDVNPSSMLSQISPFSQSGAVDKKQYAKLFPHDIANPVMAAHGGMVSEGIMSVCPPKKRQMVS